jgi:uncharacterized protein (DUF952 family)
MAIILHITAIADWDAARAAGSYRPPSLALEGFIHCSTPSQVIGSANKFFRGRTDLLLLCIDEARVAAEIRYEPPLAIGGVPDPRAGERFPHVYGPLGLDAVVRVVPLPCDRDGSFTLPAGASD